jgi:hypothetical protein
MPMVEEDAFGEQPVARIFIAATVAEARQAEAVLGGRGVNYFVRVEKFGRTLFGSPRNGAAFFVSAGQADYCEAALVQAGLGLGVVRDDPPGAGKTNPG